MSVINQALKKTQSALEQQAKAAPKPPVDAPQVSQPPKSAVRWHKRYLWMGILAPMVVATGYLYGPVIATRDVHFYRTFFHRFTENQASQVATPPKAVIAAAPTPTPHPVPLALNGTVRMGKDRVAVINHEFYHVGDQMDGFKVDRIQFNTVTLSDPNTHEQETLNPSTSP